MVRTKVKSLAVRYHYAVTLLKELVRTDFKIRYQNSVLGYFWALLRPLFLFAILYLVFVYFLKIGQGVPHWPVAMLLGIVLWNFFTEVTGQGLRSVVNNGGLIRKINFPRYVLLFAVNISAFINLAINLSVVAVFMIINSVELSWSALLLPLLIAQMFLLALGLAFILSTIYVKYRDVSYIWEIVSQALFYGSAILFPITRIAENHEFLAKLLLLNPVAQILADARHLVISSDLPTLFSLSGSVWVAAIPIAITLVVLTFGAWLFRRRSPYFAEEA